MGSRTALKHLILKPLMLGLALTVFGSGAAFARCAPDQVTVKGSFGEARFTVDVADDAAERAQGLMNVPQMPRSKGMLFIFDPPRTVAFWMKNTLIPLDMIFTDRTGRIRHIHENAVPHDETPIPGGAGVYGVLEINGGLARQFGFEVGDALQHPLFGGGPAALPCPQ